MGRESAETITRRDASGNQKILKLATWNNSKLSITALAAEKGLGTFVKSGLLGY